ncbi:folate family ECF transporter S component [Lentilactobacillus kosonis]|uniref:Substrate-specific component FolT of folate ECF transporter n=1 Tax=Lentilactobacillus kosonis TaxID=2810561 RepID=A0A401FKR3_9LACO|nr:folate family ECF transporter S component [Lentilactobacillus kosonis]GAY72979.1 substrate-specific component FolT of folate ECF transporter [Lentilactobacillus kosonis]
MISVLFRFPKLRTLDMTMLGIIMALGLIADRLTFGTRSIQIGSGFIVVVVASYLYGPIWSATIAGLTDVIGTLISGQVYNVGFTISAIFGALIYGWLLYDKPVRLARVVIAQILIAIFVNLILNTIWISLGSTYQAPTQILILLFDRLIKQIIMTPIQIAIIYTILKSSQFIKIKRKYY